MFDDYDLEHTKNKATLNFYCKDFIWDFNTPKEFNESGAIETIKKNVTVNDDDFYKRVLLTIIKLKNGLDILDNRSITNIGARVHCSNKENYSEDFGSRVDWYLVQVWRGASR